MSASLPGPGDTGTDGTGAGPDVAAAVHRLHRRRGWSWTLGGSVMAFIAFVAVGTNFWPNANGALGVISGFIVIALLALFLLSLIMVASDTVWLRRRPAQVRADAASQVTHYPLAAHPFRTPVRHRTSHIFIWFFLLIWIGASIGLLPEQVNAVGYAVGAGSTVTFFPRSYQQVCGRSGCSNETNGDLLTIPPIQATWPDQVPLDQPFPVRQPVWDAWGSPALMNGAEAGGFIFSILIVDIPAILVVVSMIRKARKWLRRRRDPAMPMITTTG